MVNHVNPRSHFSLLSYRSGTGQYLYHTQRVSRGIQKKTGWVAATIFDRFAAVGLPVVCVLDGVLIEPIRRLTDRAYSRDVSYLKETAGVICTLIKSVVGIITAEGGWEMRDIDYDLILWSHDEDWVLRCLLAGANPNAYRKITSELRAVNNSALGEACKEAHIRVVKELIRRDVDVNVKVAHQNEKEGRSRGLMSPLALTLEALTRDVMYGEARKQIRKRRVEIATLLIHAGAKVKNSSALSYAVKQESPQIVELLLKKKAKLPRGYTALDIAMEFNLSERVVQGLKKPISLKTLKKALLRGSWNAIHLYSQKTSLKNILGESLYDTVSGSLICLYLKLSQNDEDLGDITAFLQEMKEMPTEREFIEIQGELKTVLERVASYPKMNLLLLCGRFMPLDYESWISRFKAYSPYSQGFEPGRDIAKEMIRSYYNASVKFNAPQRVGDYSEEGALVHLSEIVRCYLISHPYDENLTCLQMFN